MTATTPAKDFASVMTMIYGYSNDVTHTLKTYAIPQSKPYTIP